MRALVLAFVVLFSPWPCRADAGSATASVQEWRVDGGTTGMLVENHRAPVVTVRVAFPAGTWGAWGKAHHLEEAFELQMHDPPGALRRRADELAVQLWLSAGSTSSSVWMSCLKQDLPAALALLKDVLANRDYDRDELKRRQQTRSLGWSASQKEPQFVIGRAAMRLLVKDGDPRGRMFEEPAAVEHDPAKLSATRDAAIRFPGRIVGFAGDMSLEEAHRAAEGLLPAVAGELPPDAAPAYGPLTPAAARPRDRVVTLPRLTQVYFAYGRDSLAWRDADYAASMIANHVLGGHFNSRLMTALRHEGGETYGAGVRSMGGREPSAYGMATYTRTDNAAKTEQKLRNVLAVFHHKGITEEERADAASYLVGRRAFQRQAPSQILETRLGERMDGLPDGFFDALAEEAAALPLADVNAFIARFYDPAQFTMLKLRAP